MWLIKISGSVVYQQKKCNYPVYVYKRISKKIIHGVLIAAPQWVPYLVTTLYN